MSSPATLYETIRTEAGKVVLGNEDILEGLTISLLTGGHVLLEGVPGVAKTTIANTFTTTLGLTYSRIQMTPDMVPADIMGTNVYRQNTGEFELKQGQSSQTSQWQTKSTGRPRKHRAPSSKRWRKGQ